MGKNRITLDIAQLEIVNHLPPMKAGILIKAVVSYCTTGDVASWGADADLRPIFLTLKETIEKCREEDNVKQGKDKRSERNRRYYLRRIKTIQTIKTSYKESEEEERSKEEEVKESNKEKINITIYEKKANKQTELFESETAHTEAKEPRFQKPSLAEVADYIRARGSRSQRSCASFARERRRRRYRASFNAGATQARSGSKDWSAAACGVPGAGPPDTG